MKTYVGEYRHTLDAKNRVFIPAKHRELLGDSFYITRKTEQCLAIYSEAEWDKLSDKLNALPDSVVGIAKQFLFSKTISASSDSQGRVVIPTELLQYAGIEKNVVIIGVGDHVQIWSEPIWTEKNNNIDMDKLRAMLPTIGL